MKWFYNPKSLEDLKRQYHKLIMKHHPDKGGNVEDMKEINAEYDMFFEQLKNVHENANGDTYKSNTEPTETPEEFKHIISRLISIEGIQIEICGSWIWITGNTYPNKNILKELHFGFSRSKKAWYYHSEPYHKRGKKTFTLNEIRDLYGSEVVKSRPVLKLKVV